MIPLTGFLAAHAVAVTHCPPWLALECAELIFSRYSHDVPSDRDWLLLAAETVHLVNLAQQVRDDVGEPSATDLQRHSYHETQLRTLARWASRNDAIVQEGP